MLESYYGVNTNESREDIKYALDELKQINFGGAA